MTDTEGTSVGSGFNAPFASTVEFGGQSGAAVGGGGFVPFADDSGAQFLDLSDLPFEEDGGAAEAQYDG